MREIGITQSSGVMEEKPIIIDALWGKCNNWETYKESESLKSRESEGSTEEVAFELTQKNWGEVGKKQGEGNSTTREEHFLTFLTKNMHCQHSDYNDGWWNTGLTNPKTVFASFKSHFTGGVSMVLSRHSSK